MPATPAAASPRRGLTLAETLVVLAALAVATATLAPVLSRVQTGSLRTISLKNLALLGEAHACYGADWDDRQFSKSPRLAGTVNGSCASYLATVGCPGQAVLGQDDIGWWGYYLGSAGACAEWGVPGNCGNWPFYQPIAFGGLQAGLGCFRIPSFRGFQEYVDGAYYRPRWFSALDTQAWEVAKPKFDLPVQFTAPWTGFAMPSYCNSPAALFHPGVFRRASQGGFRSPDAGFAEAYDVPTQAQCAHPDLKSRMTEHNWLIDPPGEINPASANGSPFRFNQGIASRPGVLFFDGSVEEMTMQQAVDDDAAVLAASGGVDGLWSRDTPFGADGYFGAQAFDDTRNSFHILTTDGIQGRDFAARNAAGDRRRGGSR